MDGWGCLPLVVLIVLILMEVNQMRAFIKLIRVPNLAIIAATQYLMLYAILIPLLKNLYVYTDAGLVKVPDLQPQLMNFQFLCLVLATIFLTAAGYVINDYFDTKTDLLNRPERVIVGKAITRRKAMTIHIVLNTLGVGFGFYVSLSIGMPFLGIVFAIVAGLLWFYSTTYKRQFLIGNILVAFLTGLVPFMVVVFEIPPLLKNYNELLISYQVNIIHIVYWIGGFAFFAFMTTLIRELIKDMEDFRGDKVIGRRSMPVVLGLKYTKSIVIMLIIITIMALLWVFLFYLSDMITLVYMIIGLLLPLLFLVYSLIKASSKKAFHFASLFSKFIMLAGMGYAFVAYYIISFK